MGENPETTALDRPATEAPSFRDPATVELRQETMIINMGPQHPSTHGVLRLVLELDGETVIRCKPVIGYLHTGIEKNTEYRTWMQGVTYVTRADYLSPFFNELAYCLGVERLLGVEALTGLRMNHAYIRIGGVVMDLPDDGPTKIRRLLDLLPGRIDEYETLLHDNPIWRERNEGVGVLTGEQALALGVTGPALRATGIGADLRKDIPYCGYESFDFDVPIRSEGDAYARYVVRLAEMRESLRIAGQALERIEETPGPVMIDDPKVGWPPRLSVGPDGIGNDPAYLRHIMEESMEALIHHFKMVTQGVEVPPGEVYSAVESPRGELGYLIVSDGGHRPYRVKIRDPSFVNLQALPVLIEGYLVADTVASVASLDPVLGGVDR